MICNNYILIELFDLLFLQQYDSLGQSDMAYVDKYLLYYIRLSTRITGYIIAIRLYFIIHGIRLLLLFGIQHSDWSKLLCGPLNNNKLMRFSYSLFVLLLP